MITLKRCVQAIAAALEDLVSVAPIARTDLEGINDPGLYIVPADIQVEMIGENRHDTYSFVVAWYGNRATDRYVDLLDMQALFSGLLTGPLPVPDVPTYLIYPEGLSFELDAQEGTLFAMFTVELYQSPDSTDDHDKPLVEVLDVEAHFF